MRLADDPLLQLFLVFGHLRRCPCPGPRFDFRPRLGQLGFALFAPLDFFGNAQPILERRAVGLLGLFQQLLDLQLQLLNGLARVLVAHRPMFAGVGQHLGSVHGHSHLSDLQQAQFLG